jgi:hypothetical protein
VAGDQGLAAGHVDFVEAVDVDDGEVVAGADPVALIIRAREAVTLAACAFGYADDAMTRAAGAQYSWDAIPSNGALNDRGGTARAGFRVAGP